jgi:hypothetical protein
MYRDYAINRELFHWVSQSRQSPHQPTVQRYITHEQRGTRVLLFVRERKTFELGTQTFTFLGPASYIDHRGERPVAFTWRLPTPMPEELFEIARSVAAARRSAASSSKQVELHGVRPGDRGTAAPPRSAPRLRPAPSSCGHHMPVRVEAHRLGAPRS